MDLPRYFPTYTDKRLSGLEVRPIFQDFGRHGHVDVLFEGSLLCTSQIQHENVSSCRLCAQIPTIPLRDTSVSVTYPFHDSVNGDIRDQPTKIRQFMRTLLVLHKCLNRKNEPSGRWLPVFQAGKKAVDAVGKHNEKYAKTRLTMVQDNLPHSVRTLCDQYASLVQDPLMQNFNPSYSGGVLACVKGDLCEPGHLLIHAEGSQLSQLYLTKVTEHKPLLEWQDVIQQKVDPVFQLDAALLNNSVFVCTRHKESCVMQTFPSSSVHRAASLRLAGAQTFSGELPTSVSISPFIAGECLVGTDKGLVYIWNVSSGILEIIAKKEPRFFCQSAWCQVEYGCHPRQLIVADRTAVEMFDHRSSFMKSIDLFALPSQLVPQRERIMAAHAHDKRSPYHMVTTDHCLFLLDQRFPGTPVMQWFPDLKGPLQYIASADYMSDLAVTNSVVLVASQYPTEAMLYPFDHGSGLPVTMPDNPWRLSQIGDINQWDLLTGKIEHMVYEKRFTTSLTGVAVMGGVQPGSLWAYQSDAYGEVFYQYYGISDGSHFPDKTCSQIAGGDKPAIPAGVREHMHTWLSHLQQQVEKLRDQWMTKHRQAELGQVQCPKGLFHHDLGNNSECAQCLTALPVEASGLDLELGMCSSCQALLGFITDGMPCLHDEDYLVPHLGSDPTFLDRCAQPTAEYPHNINTHLYLSLTESVGDGVTTDLLKQREGERRQLRQSRKEKLTAAREKRRKQRTEDITDQSEIDHEHGDKVIEDLMSSLLKPPQLPECIVEEDSNGNVSSLLSDTENKMSDVEHRSDVSFQSSQEKKSRNRSREMGLSGFLSLSDDEDFLGYKEVASMFLPLRMADPQISNTASYMQTLHHKVSMLTPETNLDYSIHQTQPRSTGGPLTPHNQQCLSLQQSGLSSCMPAPQPGQAALHSGSRSSWSVDLLTRPDTPTLNFASDPVIVYKSPNSFTSLTEKSLETLSVEPEPVTLQQKASPSAARVSSHRKKKTEHVASPQTPKIKRGHVSGF